MKRPFSSLVLLPALVLASLTSAHAQLMLSGSTQGVFAAPAVPFTTVNNGAVVSTFKTGAAIPFVGSQTAITFTGDTFAGVGDGGSFDLGSVQIKNGWTFSGTAASYASMDLFIDLPAHGVSDFKLATLLFAITNNSAFLGLAPDLYYIGYTTPETLKVSDHLVNFELGFTNSAFAELPGVAIHEEHKAKVGLYATVQFTPVPEPSTYAALAAFGLVGLVALRRLRHPRRLAA